MKKQYNVLLQSENIDYVELNVDLIDGYLLMVNDEDIQKKDFNQKKSLYV